MNGGSTRPSENDTFTNLKNGAKLVFDNPASCHERDI